MSNAFRTLLSKEVKETLRDPKILIGIIIMPMITFGVMGFFMQLSFKSIKEAALKPRMLIIDNDLNTYSQFLISTLKSNTNATLKIFNRTALSNGLKFAEDHNYPIIMVIPENFTQNVTLGLQAKIELYTLFKRLSLSEGSAASMPRALISYLNSYLVDKRLKSLAPNIDTKIFLSPIKTVNFSIIKGRIVNVPPESVVNIITSQSLTMPITVLMVLVFAMQISASSIAIEKEEKTLETLLTLPVSRLSILGSKLISSIIVAAIGSSVYLIGYTYYLGSFSSLSTIETSISAEKIGLTITPLGFTLLGISLFLAITSALVLSIVVAVYAEDVRSAQTLIGYLYFLIFIPSFALMLTDINSLPTPMKIILYIIPYTHPIIASKAALLEDYLTITYGIIYMAFFSLILLYIASRMFTTEKVITAKLSLRFKRKI
ncbi:MAG: ABC transporter permease [archaeon GB-1845-036]|nr:ABC transporter permease [Candidatus Culexmicrobium thermophilum]